MKFNQWWPVLTGQLTHVEELQSLGSTAFAVNVLRVIDFLYSSSIWCSYWTLLLLLYKLLQRKTWLDLEYMLYKEGGQTLKRVAREHVKSQCLEIWPSSVQGAEQLSLCWSWIKWGLDGLQRALATFSIVLCLFFFKKKPHLHSQNINPNIQTLTEF